MGGVGETVSRLLPKDMAPGTQGTRPAGLGKKDAKSERRKYRKI